jgi:hypothetical protein
VLEQRKVRLSPEQEAIVMEIAAEAEVSKSKVIERIIESYADGRLDHRVQPRGRRHTREVNFPDSVAYANAIERAKSQGLVLSVIIRDEIERLKK